MPEQMNLSDALDLIAQSKADIKSSVQGKGGTIGDDLTQYDQSISNIKFEYLSSDLFNQGNYVSGSPVTFAIKKYNDTTHLLEDIDPSEVTVSVSPTMIQDLEAYTHLTYDTNIATITKEYLWPDQEQGTVVQAVAGHTGGKMNVIVHYDKGNLDYVGTILAGDSLPISIEIGSAEDTSGTAYNTTSNWIQADPNNTIRIYFAGTVNGGAYTFESNDSFEIFYDPYRAYNSSWNGTYLTLTPRNNTLSGVDKAVVQVFWHNTHRDLACEAFTFTISLTQPANIYFSSPANGSTVTGEIDPETNECHEMIEVIDANGNAYSPEILETALSSEDCSIACEYDGETGLASYAYVILHEGQGSATITFTDPDTSATCSTTFDYDISAPQE